MVSLNRYLQADLEAFDIRELKSKFDVILLEPPLEEYYRETGITANEKCWTWDDVSSFSYHSKGLYKDIYKVD